MTVAQVSSLFVPINASASLSRVGVTRLERTQIGTTFASGSPLLMQRSANQNKLAYKMRSGSIRCEQSTKGNGVDVWLGRLAMLGFAVGISVEIATGKGLLENFGLITPLPTAALAVTGLVGVLTAIFIFQSASDN